MPYERSMRVLFWAAMFTVAAMIGVMAGNFAADLTLSSTYARVF